MYRWLGSNQWPTGYESVALHQLSYIGIWSGVRESNPHIQLGRLTFYRWTNSALCGQGGIRTPEGVSQQIYSLPVLTTYLPTQFAMVRGFEPLLRHWMTAILTPIWYHRKVVIPQSLACCVALFRLQGSNLSKASYLQCFNALGTLWFCPIPWNRTRLFQDSSPGNFCVFTT